MKYKVKLLLFSILGILILGSSVAYAYSSNMITQQEAKENDTLISHFAENRGITGWEYLCRRII